MIQCCNRANSKHSSAHQFANASLRERSALLARLVNERGKTHVLCAPSSYGKSVLAYQFANLITSLNEVIWVDASNPQFALGLSVGNKTDALMEACESATMVVFDNLANLNSAQLACLCALIDQLKTKEKTLLSPRASSNIARFLVTMCMW